MSQNRVSVRQLRAVRYVTPLREGGSLPAVVEADDGNLHVMKFVGAGQGAKALIAELIGGEIGRALGLPVPEIVLLDMDEELGRSEPDEEIQDLLQASSGLNLGMAYLPGAISFDTLLEPQLDPLLASQIVWFDAFITNVDRTPRNINMLVWEGRVWLIDHGASLYFHHDWPGYLERSRSPFAFISQHALLPRAGKLAAADRLLRPQLTSEVLAEIVALIPDEWLGGEEIFDGVEEQRQAYLAYLESRVEAADRFVTEAENAYRALG